MTEARKLKSLKLQLSAVKQSIDAIVAFAENANQNHVEVAVRRDNLKKLYARFITIQDELLPLDEENGDQHFAYRQVVEDAFYKAEGILSCACVNDEKKIVPASKVKLPDIKLPTFDGKPKEWTNFHSIFASMIHGAPQYTGIQKLYYLRTSLSGPALQLIQSVPITEENYEVAWQLLLCHYNEPKKIKQFYVESLFENAALKKESASDLRKVVETFEANVSALKHLGEPTAQWDTLLIHMLSHQLDATTLRSWKEYATEKSVETFKDLVAFIYRRVSVLDDLPTTTVMKPTKHRVLTTQTTTSKDCAFCSLQHPLYTCSEFFKLSLQDKEKFVIGCKLCLNCLRPGHRARECKSTSTCKKCRKRHHTQLCSSLLQQCDSPALKEHTDPPTTSAKSSVAESITCASSGQRKHTLLATATVILVDDDGKEHFARALLDSGSDTCFITENLAQQLKSRKEKTNLKISGISSTTTTTKYCIRATLHSRIGRYFADLQFFVLPKITENIPSSSIDTSGWNLPSNIFLADPHYDSSNKIDLLIGAEVFFEIMKPPGRIHLGKDLPTLVNSELGWIVTGPVVSTLMSSFKSIVVHHATTSVNEVHKLMEQFWTIEEGNTTSLMSSEQAACEEHFRNTVSRTSLGRYIVRLPLKTQTLDKLVNNRKTAVRRFHLLQTRLNYNEDLRKRYSSFIDDISQNNLANEESFCFDRDHVIKTLGLRWHPLTDTMTYGIHSQNEMQPITKRSALSNIARLFDPIGLVGPVVTKAKVFMQSLWTLKANDGSCWEWDTELPEEYKQKWLISKFSDYRKLIRVLAHCIRFVQNLRTSTNTSILSADEVMNAECRLIHVVQTEIFEREWNQLSQNLPVSTKSRLKWFHPFVSSDNLIRIGGRISRSNQPYDVKHQILLTASHPLSVLLVRHLHEKHLHAAPQLLLTILRQRYWLIGARSLAKRICHECVTCCRARPRLLEQFMAELPRTRVNPSRPFSIVGVDYWGPIINIEIGQLVLVKDESTGPLHWPLGRIIKLHPGNDGLTRVVTLKTAS
uniref:CCHC-type domain-containing protein n=1 Tax=Anopheles minimus TaxID=112268 RepID=A0A182WI52_9DIPT